MCTKIGVFFFTDAKLMWPWLRGSVAPWLKSFRIISRLTMYDRVSGYQGIRVSGVYHIIAAGTEPISRHLHLHLHLWAPSAPAYHSQSPSLFSLLTSHSSLVAAVHRSVQVKQSKLHDMIPTTFVTNHLLFLFR